MNYSLMEVAVQVTRSIVPVIIILGVIANFLNIIILRRSNLKHFGCSLYFVTMSINNLFYLSICITYNLLLDGYDIDLVRYSSFFCKLISYFLNLCPYISVFMLILASIDRYLSSSLNVQRRRLSNIRNARWLILIVLIIISIFISGSAIMFDAYNDDVIGCTSKSDSLFNKIFLTIEVIIYAIISPFLLILFGMLTIYNINKLNRNRLRIFRYRRNERQLVRMLIVQVSTHIILSLPFLTLFFMLIIPIPFRLTIIYYFLFIIFKIPVYISCITPFFLYILTAQLYRIEFILLLKKIIRIRHQRIINPIGNQPRAIPMNVLLPTNYNQVIK